MFDHAYQNYMVSYLFSLDSFTVIGISSFSLFGFDSGQLSSLLGDQDNFPFCIPTHFKMTEI